MSGKVVVYGGRGALGSEIVNKFKSCGWWVANIDIKANDTADENIVAQGESWQTQEEMSSLSDFLAFLLKGAETDQYTFSY